MITPSNFLTNNNLANLRLFMLDHSTIEEIVIIDGNVFNGVSVDNAIFILQGNEKTKTFQITHCTALPNSLVITENSIVHAELLKDDPHHLFLSTQNNGRGTIWEKITRTCLTLGEIAYVNFGKQLRDRKKFTTDIVRVVSLSEVLETHVPCYTGKDVNRYTLDWNKLSCLNDRIAQSGGCWDESKQRAVNKLVTRQIGQYPIFGVDKLGYDCLNTVFMVNPKTEE